MKLEESIEFIRELIGRKPKLTGVALSGWYEPTKVDPIGVVWCDYREADGRKFFVESFSCRMFLTKIANGDFKVVFHDPFPEMAKTLLES